MQTKLNTFKKLHHNDQIATYSKLPNISLTYMPYLCSLFYLDIKSVTKSDIRFNIRLWTSFHVKPYHKS